MRHCYFSYVVSDKVFQLCYLFFVGMIMIFIIISNINVNITIKPDWNLYSSTSLLVYHLTESLVMFHIFQWSNHYLKVIIMSSWKYHLRRWPYQKNNISSNPHFNGLVILLQGVVSFPLGKLGGVGYCRREKLLVSNCTAVYRVTYCTVLS